MEKIAATKVQHLLRCTEKYNLRKTKIKLFTSNSNQIVRLDGIILHALMEDLINSRNYSPSSQEIKDLIINEEKKHFEDELLYTSLDFIRTQSIVDAVKNTLFNIQNKFNLDEYKVETEKQYVNNDLFIGTADLVLSNEKDSVVLDYKSGYVLDDSNEIKTNFSDQVLVYQYLESLENKGAVIKGYLSDKYGNLHEVENGIEDFTKLKSNVEEHIESIKLNKQIIPKDDECNKCSFGNICEFYSFTTDDIQNTNFLNGKVESISHTAKDYLINITGTKGLIDNQVIIIQVPRVQMSNLEEIIEPDQLITIGPTKFLQAVEGKFYFRVFNYFDIYLI